MQKQTNKQTNGGARKITFFPMLIVPIFKKGAIRENTKKNLPWYFSCSGLHAMLLKITLSSYNRQSMRKSEEFLQCCWWRYWKNLGRTSMNSKELQWNMGVCVFLVFWMSERIFKGRLYSKCTVQKYWCRTIRIIPIYSIYLQYSFKDIFCLNIIYFDSNEYTIICLMTIHY